MNDPSIDPERLAALLDGKLDAEERARLLAEIADSPEALDTLEDVLAVQRELESPTAGPLADPVVSPPVDPVRTPPVEPPRLRVLSLDDTPEVPDRVPVGIDDGGALPWRQPIPVPTPTPPRRVVPWRRGALAAAAVVLVSVGIWSQSRDAGALADPASLVALVAAPAPARGDALGEVPWSVTRGAGDALTARARAVRFGVRAAELAFAVREGDAARVRLLAAQAAALVGEIGGSGPAAALYWQVRDAAGASADSLAALLRHGWDAAAPLVGAEEARLGAWLAAARIAAARRDAAFFRTPMSRGGADALAARTDLSADSRDAARRLIDAVRGDADPRWEPLGRDVDAVLATLGS